MVLDVDEERRRISLGIKQCTANPWEAFAAIFKKGDKVSGQIKSITDFGIFIGLDGGIDGLVHLSDISWNAHRRRPGPQLQEGRQPRSRGAGRRSGARAHLARRQAAGAGSVRPATWRRTRRAASSPASSRKSTPRARRSISATASRATCAPTTSPRSASTTPPSTSRSATKVEAKFIGMDRKGRITAALDPRQGRGRPGGSDGRSEQVARRLQRHHQARRAAARTAEQGRVSPSPDPRPGGTPPGRARLASDQ